MSDERSAMGECDGGGSGPPVQRRDEANGKDGVEAAEIEQLPGSGGEI
jgi:hypothetical protein